MAVLEVQLPAKNPHFTVQLELEGVTYGLELRWNTVDEAWYLSVLNGEGVLIIAGRKVVIDFPLLSRFADARLPPGEFFAVDTSGNHEDATFEDFGTRVKLLYFESTELAA
jgi:hypothetical protein